MKPKPTKFVPWFEVTDTRLKAKARIHEVVKTYLVPLILAAADAKQCKVGPMEHVEGFTIAHGDVGLVNIHIASSRSFYSRAQAIRLTRRVNSYGSGKVRSFDFVLNVPGLYESHTDTEERVWIVSVELDKLKAKITSLLDEELETHLRRDQANRAEEEARRHREEFAGGTIALVRSYNIAFQDGPNVLVDAIRVTGTDTYTFDLRISSLEPESIAFGGAVFPGGYVGTLQYTSLTPQGVYEVINALQRIR